MSFVKYLQNSVAPRFGIILVPTRASSQHLRNRTKNVCKISCNLLKKCPSSLRSTIKNFKGGDNDNREMHIVTC